MKYKHPLSQIYQSISALLHRWWFFRKKKRCIAILGSSRFSIQNVYAQKAYQLSQQLAQKKYCILTGGGYGIMEAASQGAYDVNGFVAGCYVKSLEPVNTYLSQRLAFDSLITRQAALIQYSEALVIFPGGFGTLDELLAALVCLQNKQKKLSIFLVGTDFWKPLIQYFKEILLEQHQTISSEDLNTIFIEDSMDAIITQLEAQFLET